MYTWVGKVFFFPPRLLSKTLVQGIQVKVRLNLLFKLLESTNIGLFPKYAEPTVLGMSAKNICPLEMFAFAIIETPSYLKILILKYRRKAKFFQEIIKHIPTLQKVLVVQ